MGVCVIFRIILKLKDFGWYAKEKMKISYFLLILLQIFAVISNTSDNRTLTKQNLVSALCFAAVRGN